MIAANLYNAGLIGDADLFVDYVRAYDIDVQLQAGTYFLKRSQSIRQIASRADRFAQQPDRLFDHRRLAHGRSRRGD